MLLSDNQVIYADVLAALHRTCFERPWDTSAFKALLVLPTTVVWLEKECFLVCSHVLDEMEILTIGVAPSARRQGRGRALLNQMVTYAREHQVSRIFLEVSVENEAAYRLYTQNGFECTGRRKQYYQTEHGLVDAFCLTQKILP